MFASICIVCEIYFRPGLLPGSHGYCRSCMVLVDAYADDTRALEDEITVLRSDLRPERPQGDQVEQTTEGCSAVQSNH